MVSFEGSERGIAQSAVKSLAASQTIGRLVLFILAIFTLAPCTRRRRSSNPTPPSSGTLGPTTSSIAQNAENKFVLMDLEAVWCHWCHVMDETTYRDPAVIRLINQKYIAVKVDQDSRPDIANRYEDYGWPATVVFNASGGEIVKRRGYIEPPAMASMLQAIIDDPTPGPSVPPETDVRAAQRCRAVERPARPPHRQHQASL